MPKIAVAVDHRYTTPAHGLLELVEKVIDNKHWRENPHERLIHESNLSATELNLAAMNLLIKMCDDLPADVEKTEFEQRVIANTATAIQLFMAVFNVD